MPLAFLVALLAIGFVMHGLTAKGADSSEHLARTLGFADRAAAAVTDANRAAVTYARTHSAADVRRYEALKATVPAHLTALSDAVGTDPASQARAKRYDAAIAAVFPVLDRYIAAYRTHDTAVAKAIETSPATRRLGEELAAAKTALDNGERGEVIGRLADLRRRLFFYDGLLVALTFIGIVATLLLAARYGLRLATRLRALAANAARLAHGEHALPISGHDEIAALDQSYRDMARQLDESFVQREAAVAAYERERQVALSLQRALLPAQQPPMPGLRIDTAYVPAASENEVGGDWYDVFRISENLVGISIGDVAGHGLRAATIMGSIRQSIRTAARIEQQPSRVLRQVNRVLCADESAAIATAMFGTLDQTDGTLRWSIAGHPPPIVVRPDAGVSTLEGKGLVLGLDERSTYEDFVTKLDVGCGLVLYTDGIVEVERDYFKGMRDLEAAVLAEYADPQANIADGIQRRILNGAVARDDSAVLFLGVTQLGVSAHQSDVHSWDLDARDMVSVRRTKRALMWQIAGLAAGEPEFTAVELIYGELLGNVARHTPGPATVTLDKRGLHAILHVDDQGAPFTPHDDVAIDPLAESGRGLFLVSHLSLGVTVTRTATGNRTSVVLPTGTNAIELRRSTDAARPERMSA